MNLTRQSHPDPTDFLGTNEDTQQRRRRAGLGKYAFLRSRKAAADEPLVHSSAISIAR